MIDFKSLWTSLDWIVLIAYFAGVLLVGVSMHKKAGKSFKSFAVASRKLTVPILIGVAAASWYDSWTIVGVAESGWTMGISIIFIFIIPESILRLPLAVIIGPHVRDKIPDWVVTAPDLIGYLYDKKVKLVGAVMYLANILYDSALLFAIGDVLRMVTGLSIVVSLVIAGVVIALYTALSGLWGLAVTDLIQFAIMTVAGGTLIIGIVNVFGGFDKVFDGVRAIDPVLMTPLGHNTGWEAVAWIVSACAMYSSLQCYQRFSSARSGADIKVAYTIMLTMGLCFATVMALSGMAALVHFGDTAGSPAEGFWALVFTVLPVGMRGLFVAALCAAVMSTVSADWLIFGICIVNDIVKSYLRPNMKEKNVILGSRITIAVLGVLCVVGTYLWKDGISKAWFYLGGFMFSMFCIPIVAGLFYKKKTNQGGLACVVWSAATYVIWEFVLQWPFGIPSSVFVAVTGAIVYFVVCNLTYKKPNAETVQER